MKDEELRIEKQKPVVELKRFYCKDHRFHHGPFQVDPELDTVTCGTCQEKLNPMAVMKYFCEKDGEYARRADGLRQRIQELEAALQFKNKVKCQSCGKFTPLETKLRKEKWRNQQNELIQKIADIAARHTNWKKEYEGDAYGLILKMCKKFLEEQ